MLALNTVTHKTGTSASELLMNREVRTLISPLFDEINAIFICSESHDSNNSSISIPLHLNNFAGYQGINTSNRTKKIIGIHHNPRSYTLLNDKKNIIPYNRSHDIKSLEMEQETVVDKPTKLTRGNRKSMTLSRNNETIPPHDVQPTQTNYSPYATRSGRRVTKPQQHG